MAQWIEYLVLNGRARLKQVYLVYLNHLMPMCLWICTSDWQNFDFLCFRAFVCQRHGHFSMGERICRMRPAKIDTNIKRDNYKTTTQTCAGYKSAPLKMTLLFLNYLNVSLVLKSACPCSPVPWRTNKWLKSPCSIMVWTSNISLPRCRDKLKQLAWGWQNLYIR